MVADGFLVQNPTPVMTDGVMQSRRWPVLASPSVRELSDDPEC